MALGLEVSDFPEMQQLKAEIKPLIQLWETIDEFDAKITDWKNLPLAIVSVDEIDEKCNDWFRKLNYCKKNPQLMKLKGPMQFCDYILR